MVNDPSSLDEMAHPQGHSADYILIQNTFLADISTTELSPALQKKDFGIRMQDEYETTTCTQILILKKEIIR